MTRHTIHSATFLLAAGALALYCTLARAGTADFEIGLADNSVAIGADFSPPGSFASGGMTFNNKYIPPSPPWDAVWAGWACSSMTDTTKPDWNQWGYWNKGLNAITGSGADSYTDGGASKTYGVAYLDSWPPPTVPTVTIPDSPNPQNPTTVVGAYVTNTVYDYYTMKSGNEFSRPFDTNDRPLIGQDNFKLIITGKDANGIVTGTKEVFLADYRFSNPAKAYIVDYWKWVDLTGLGSNVKKLEWTFASTDLDAYANMNTPAYVAVDNLTTAAYSAWTGGGDKSSLGDPANWNGGTLPPYGGAVAFGNANLPQNGRAAVILDDGASNHLSALSFNTTQGQSYTIEGFRPILMFDGAAAVSVNGGSHTINVLIYLHNSLNVSTATGTILTISKPITFDDNMSPYGLTLSGGGTLILTAVPQYLGNTIVRDTATLTYDDHTAGGQGFVYAGAALTIDPGAKVNAGGTVDPFTDGSNSTRHINILNNGQLNITEGGKQVGTLSGAGATDVSTGAMLVADSIVQDTLVIGAGGAVVIRETATQGASAVPEPGLFALLLGGGILVAARWLGRRRRAGIARE